MSRAPAGPSNTCTSDQPFRRRLASMVLVALVVMAVPHPQPAKATTIGAMALNGNFHMSNGIAHACMTGKTSPPPNIDPNKCASTANTATVTFTGTVVGGFGHGPKGPKSQSFEIGTWSLTSSGAATGTCTLMTATLTGALIPAISLGTKVKSRSLVLTLTRVAEVLVITGSTSKGEIVTGLMNVLPTVGTCMNKAAKGFTMTGQLTFLRA